jgi:flagellar export protein FliJ
MRFVFGAQAALELRRREDDEARRDLAAAESRRAQAARDLADAESSLAEVVERSVREDARAGAVAVRIWYRNWIAHERRRVARARSELVARDADVEEAATAARAARVRREALEHLRARAEAAWTRAATRREQQVIDELAIARFWRSRTGGRA